jgi:pyrophosphatase PpaX
MIEAVLLDLDGTLINTNDLIIKSFQYTFSNNLRKEVREEEIVKYFGEPLVITMGRFDSKEPEKLVETYRKFNEESHDLLAKSFNGAKEALKLLKSKNIKTAVVTSKRKTMAEKGLRLFELYEYIDVLITPECTTKHKPNGEPAILACNLINVKPKNAIMVGDSHFDILCGQNAGCRTCLVSYTELAIDEVKDYKPDYIIDNLLELDEIIFNKAQEV